MKYRLPERFDDDHLGFIKNDLNELVCEPEVLWDFSGVRFVYPFATLAITAALLDFRDSRRAAGLPDVTGCGFNASPASSYLQYFGFFKTLGFNVGNAPNAAPGGLRYLPITILRKEDLEKALSRQPIQDAIDRESDRLSQVIFPDDRSAAAAYMLSYCFREMIRNAFEHGQADRCAVMAQRWDDGRAEIAIADRGIGIHAALTQAHNSEAPEDSLKKALLPGITSGAHRSTGSKWDNSGFGLYVASELGKRYGGFSLASSGGFLRLDDVESYDDLPTPGTIVKLRVNTSEAAFFDYVLHEIVEEGEKLALHIPGAIRSASKTSKSLRV